MDGFGRNKASRKSGWKRLIYLIIAIVFVPLFTLIAVLNIPVVQTQLGKWTAHYLSNEWQVNVQVGRLNFDLFAQLHIEELLISDKTGDTLCSTPDFIVTNYFLNSEYNWEIESVRLVSPKAKLITNENGEQNWNFLVDYFKSRDSLNSTKKSSFTLKKLEIVDGDFVWIDKRYQHVEDLFDLNHMDWNGLNLKLSQLSLLGDVFSVDVAAFSGKESCGLSIERCTANLFYKNEELNLGHFEIQTDKSELSGKGKVNFIADKKILLDGELTATPINLNELRFITKANLPIDESIYLNCKFQGGVDELNFPLIQIETGLVTRLMGRGSVKKMTDFENFELDFEIDHLTTVYSDLCLLTDKNSSKSKKILPSNLSTLGLIEFDGHIKGSKDDWRLYGAIGTEIGEIKGDIDLKIDENEEYLGFVRLNKFNIGKYYSNNVLGEVTGELDIDGSGFSLNNLEAYIDGDFSQFCVDGYCLTGIKTNGKFKRDGFEGLINVNDPNAELYFNGFLDFGKRVPELSCELDIVQLNFKEMGWVNQVPYSALSGQIKLDSKGLNLDEIEGELLLEHMTYCVGKEDYLLDYLSLQVNRKEELQVVLNSDIAVGQINGDFHLDELPAVTTQLISEVLPNYNWSKFPHQPQKFVADIEFFDFSQISAVLFPTIGVAQNSTISLSVDEEASFFECVVVSDSISFSDYVVHGLMMDIRKPDEFVYASLGADSVKSGPVFFDQISLDLRSESENIYTSLSWGKDSSLHSGDLNGRVYIKSEDDFAFEFYNGSFRANRDVWHVQSGAQIEIEPNQVWIDNFNLKNGKQLIALVGGIGASEDVPLVSTLENVKLEGLNPFLPDDIQLSGNVNGVVSWGSMNNTPQLTGDIALEKFGINQVLYGDLMLSSVWDSEIEGLKLKGNLEKEEVKSLTFDGYYYPFDSTKGLDVNARLKDLDLGFLSSFLDREILVVTGSASAEVHINGALDAPQLYGEARLKDSWLYIDYLKTSFKLNDKVGIRPDMFMFNNLKIVDVEGNSGRLTGTIMHEAFSNWDFDVVMDMETRMKVLNTTVDDNPDYYGIAYATGYLNIAGFEDQLMLDMSLKTAAGTKLALPMNTTEEVVMDQFIQFVSSKKQKDVDENPLDLSGVNLNIQLDVTSDAELSIIFDEAVGDVMKGSGVGHLSMGVTNLSTFNMYGQIEITNGNYLFTLMNLFNKDFTVKPGGTINWYGDPYNAELDLAAVYKVNTSLSQIISDDAQNSGKRVPVDLVMNLKGKMLNPGVDFQILLPTVDPTTRSRFEAVVSTEQERNRQAFSLLVLRSFVSPPNIVKTAGTGNYGVVENSTELLSSQISNWLSQISDDFNLGFNYRSGDQISNQEIALALSTQLFDNRVQVSGNFGVSRGNSINQQPTNYIGDVKVEYLLLPDGRVKLIAYNESNNYRNVSTQQSPYTQGVGIVYQEEFNRWSDLFKKRKLQ
jgi:hypothetical protein